MIVSTACGAAPELVKNGSFELDANGDGTPDDWRISSKVSHRIETQGVFDGKRCLFMKREEGSRYALATQPVRVKPRTGYRCRATIRAPHASHYLLVAYKPGLNSLAAKRSEWAVYPKWTTLALDFRTEEQTTIYVGLLAYGKEVYWDEVELWEDDTVRIGDVSPTVNELPLPLTEAEERRGFLTFTRPLCANTSARHVPSREECSREVTAFSPAGEVETLMVMVHARRDLTALRARLKSDWTADHGGRLLAKHAEVFRIGYTHRPINTQAYLRSPLLLLPCRPGDLAKGDVAQFAVRMDVPGGVDAGVYGTALEILVGDQVTATVPLKLSVLDIKLDPADVSYLMYYSDNYLLPELATGERQQLYYRDMAKHGMNSVSLYLVPERADAGGKYAIDLDHDYRYKPDDPRYGLGLRQRLDQMATAGLTAPTRPIVLISGGRGLYDWGCFRGRAGSVREILRLGKQHGWPPLLFYVMDEPNTERRIKFVRGAFKNRYDQVPEARTVTAIANEGIEAVGGLYDVWITALSSLSPELLGKASKMGKEVWAYDCRHRGQRPKVDRYLCGWFAWASGVRGMCQWAYYSRKEFERDEDGQYVVPKNWQEWYVAMTEDGPLATVGWEAKREGVEDYRYLTTLARLAAQPGGGGAAALLRKVKANAPLDSFVGAPRDIRYVWEFDPASEVSVADFGKVRAQAAQLIAQLSR